MQPAPPAPPQAPHRLPEREPDPAGGTAEAAGCAMPATRRRHPSHHPARRFRAITLALALAGALSGGITAAAQEARPHQQARQVTLEIAEARQLARAANARADYPLALEVSLALLQRDPNDQDALIQAASALIGLGRYDEAVRMARRAHAATRNPAQRVLAARLAASAHFRAGRHVRSEFWLRRAFNAAGDARTRTLLRQEFARVRQENPFTATISLSIAPNDNINNGSAAETITIWNLPFVLSPDARALSGTEAAASIGLNLRLSRGPRHETAIALNLYGRSYELSSESRAAAPDVAGSDYAFAMAEMSLTHARRFEGLPGPTAFGITLGRYWYGGAPYIRYGRAQITQGFELAGGMSASLRLGRERQRSDRAGGALSDISTLGGSLGLPLAGGARLNFDLQAAHTESDDPTADNDALRVQIGYAPQARLLGAKLAFSLGVERRDYPVSVYDPDGRHDLTLSAGARMIFDRIGYLGFSPVLSLETSRTRSNVALYERRSTGLRLSIQSTF